jgi:tartrate dehydrogenase/decarboxylase/D-malate dehydrogenase
MAAIERTTADPRFRTADLGGSADTKTVTDAVVEAVRAGNA